MLPQEIKKSVDDLQSPSNRILVILMIISIMVIGKLLFSLIGNNNDKSRQEEQECKEVIRKKDERIDSLFNVIIMKTDLENERLRNKDRWQDSIKIILQNEIKSEIKKSAK